MSNQGFTVLDPTYEQIGIWQHQLLDEVRSLRGLVTVGVKFDKYNQLRWVIYVRDDCLDRTFEQSQLPAFHHNIPVTVEMSDSAVAY